MAHIGNFVNSGIVVINQSAMNGEGAYISMFNVIDDETLLLFQKRNVANRSVPIISDPARRARPLNCSGNEQIANDSNWAALPNWVHLNTSSPAQQQMAQASADK